MWLKLRTLLSKNPYTCNFIKCAHYKFQRGLESYPSARPVLYAQYFKKTTNQNILYIPDNNKKNIYYKYGERQEVKAVDGESRLSICTRTRTRKRKCACIGISRQISKQCPDELRMRRGAGRGGGGRGIVGGARGRGAAGRDALLFWQTHTHHSVTLWCC